MVGDLQVFIRCFWFLYRRRIGYPFLMTTVMTDTLHPNPEKKEDIWNKYEEACTAHSKMSWNMLILVAILFISTVLTDSQEVKEMLKSMNTWFYIGYFALINGFVYSYTTYFNKVTYWHDRYAYHDLTDKIADNRMELQSFYTKFIIQFLSVLVCYILLFITVLYKYGEIANPNASCKLNIIVYGSISIVNLPWLWWFLHTMYLFAKWAIEDKIEQMRERK